MNQKPERDSEQDFIPPPAGYRESRWGFRGKKVWDWLQLLIVPFIITSFGIVWTTTQQNVRDAEMANQQAVQQQKIEEERAQDTTDRAQAATLQGYLETMKTLLLDEGLRAAAPDSSVRVLAQTETLAAFSELDPQRKALALQFLYESSLIEKKSPIVDLSDLSLSRIHPKGISLSGADLHSTNLRNAKLRNANLGYADLTGADLRGAVLRGAVLRGAVLRGAEGVTQEQLAQPASLKGAIMPNGQKYEDWLKDRGHE